MMSRKQAVQPTSDELAVEGFFDKEYYSPYELAGKANEVLAALGLNKTIPPQMIYQYVRKNIIRGSQLERPGKRGSTVVTKADGVAWLIKYLDANYKNDWRVLSKAGL